MPFPTRLYAHGPRQRDLRPRRDRAVLHPWSFAFAHGQTSTLNGQLGGAALPPFDPFHILFVCLMGSIVLVWSLLRLRAPA